MCVVLLYFQLTVNFGASTVALKINARYVLRNKITRLSQVIYANGSPKIIPFPR
jgi:hypothetical protein